MRSSDVLVTAVSLRKHLDRLVLTEYADTLTGGPAMFTPGWEMKNWNAQDDFWGRFEALMNQITSEFEVNLIDIVSVDRSGFHITPPEKAMVRRFKSLVAGSYADMYEARRAYLSSDFLSCHLVSWGENDSCNGYFEHTGVWSANKHTLANRERYFYLKAILAILPKDGNVLLCSPHQLEYLCLDENIGDKVELVYVPRLNI
jgi:hypothetical protein